jgi:hypothetical protein
MTTAVAIARLVHHCVILELSVPSYRAEQAKTAKQSRTSQGEDFPLTGDHGLLIAGEREK